MYMPDMRVHYTTQSFLSADYLIKWPLTVLLKENSIGGVKDTLCANLLNYIIELLLSSAYF